jgi:iron complex transport system substrate-binding protein
MQAVPRKGLVPVLTLIGMLLWASCLWRANPVLAAPQAVSFVDDRGVAVSLSAPAHRIVSLLPSLTETVCAMGACARLVGTDRYSNYPAPVQALPKTGGLDDANIEMIVALKPDVVLLSVSSRVIDRLTALGLTVVALEPKTYQDVQRVAAKVALVLGLPGAGEALWQRMSDQVKQAARDVPASARGMSVYFEVDSAPYAAGESSFIGHALSQLGLVNIVPASLGPFPKLNPEYVVRANPQVIMVSVQQDATLPARPGWSRIRAVKDKRVCLFSADEGDVLSRPGPRMGEAAQLMARCLRRVWSSGGAL